MRKNLLKTVALAAATALVLPLFVLKANAATITLSPSSGSVNLGESVNLSTTLTVSDGAITTDPMTSLTSTYGWRTSGGVEHMPNEIIATPSATGITFTGTANEAGTFIFTASYNMDGGSTASCTYTLTVGGGGSANTTTTKEEVIEEHVVVPGPTAEEIRQKEIDEKLEAFFNEGSALENKTVGSNKSSVNGFFYARNVNGVAVQPTASDKNSYVRVADTDKNKSKNAVGVANLVASTYKGTVGPCLNVNYGNMVDGKFVPSTTGSAGYMWIGIPGNFRANGAKYSVIAIYEGGSYKIFDNIVNAINPADSGNILINLPEATSANVMYALVRS